MPPGLRGSLFGRTVSSAGTTPATTPPSPPRSLTILALGVRPLGGRGRVEPLGIGRHGLDEIGRDLIPPRFPLGNVFGGTGQPGHPAAGSLLVAATICLPASGGTVLAIPRHRIRPVALSSAAATSASATPPPPPAVFGFIALFAAAARGASVARSVVEPPGFGPLARLGGNAVVECRSTLALRPLRFGAIGFPNRRAAVLADGFSRSSGRLIDGSTLRGPSLASGGLVSLDNPEIRGE